MLDLRYEYQVALDRWDLVLAAGQPDVTTVSDLSETISRVKQYIRTFQGEWFMDLNRGLPWFQRILGNKAITNSQAAEAIRTGVLDLDGVTSVKQVDLTTDAVARRMSVALKIVTIYGGADIEEAIA
jgi:hypothetical protein